MKAPAFWWRPPGLLAALLSPAALAYGAVAARRLRGRGDKAAIPVLCVGNVTVGGAGKTPAAIALAAALQELGRQPALLTRGHGGRLAGPLWVDPDRHRFPEIGDEACLLARHALTILARDRPAGAALALAAGADVVIMDDGLQNPSLAKDLGLAVFDGAVGIGNGRVLPAGPLRAPLDAQWRLIDAVLVVGAGMPGEEIAREAGRRGVPVLRAGLRPDPDTAAALAGTRVLAFAGIGRPAKFFETLRGVGADLAATHAFSDHHPYGLSEIGRLLDEAERSGLTAVTTEKDFARLAPLATVEPRIGRVRVLPITLSFDDRADLATLLGRLPLL